MLLCPKCRSSLKREKNRYVCPHGHSYDIARQGYTHLIIHSQKEGGDNKEMVHARTRFLEQGYYRCLREKLAAIAADLKPSVIVDAGCGEGYYTEAVAGCCEKTYAFDMSKYALMKCARRSPRLHCFVSSIFDLPLSDHSIDLVMNVFAPFAADEFVRILKPGGYILRVEPGEHHLYELKEIVYDHVYLNQSSPILDERFSLVREWKTDDVISVEGQDMIEALFQMTPYYYRSPKEGVFRGIRTFGDIVSAGETIAYVGDTPITATIDGMIRGMLHEGLYVPEGFKVADIDPRGKAADYTTPSDKAYAIAGGVLECVDSFFSGR